MNGPRTVDLRGLVLDGPAREGSGRRALRAWMVAEACCDAPSLVVGDDQRMRCGECGVWYSASHSADRMLLARSRHPVGVDVEQERPRPAAMRALARVCGLAEPGLPHWVLFEAYLKALGQAQRMPDPGQGVLPESVLHEDGGLPDGPFERLISPGSHAMGRVTLRGGVHIHYYVFSWHGGYQVAAALVCDTGPSTQPAPSPTHPRLGRAAYVSNKDDGTLSIIKDGAVVATVPVGDSPGIPAVASDGTIYVPNVDQGTITIVR